MKFLRYLLIILVVLAIAVAFLHFTAAKEIIVKREATIKASPGVVMKQVSNFKNWANWSPWYRLDSTMTITYSGEDGAVGSGYHWAGNKDVGEGEMNSTAITNDSMGYHLHFIKPWEGHSDGSFTIRDDSKGGSIVTWAMYMENKFPGTVMSVFMDMDKMIGKDFEKGLANMSEYIDAHPDASSAYKIVEVQFPGHNYATMRQTLKTDDDSAMMKFFGDSYTAMGKEAGARINGPASCLAYKWDEATKTCDLAAAFPVSGDGAVKGATMVKVAPSAAYMIAYTGNYNGFMSVHGALGKHVATSGKTQGLVIEEYIIGPEQEKDPNKYLTNIYYLVQ